MWKIPVKPDWEVIDVLPVQGAEILKLLGRMVAASSRIESLLSLTLEREGISVSHGGRCE